MKLLFVLRHGDYSQIGNNDCLSEIGIEQVKEVATNLKSAFEGSDHISLDATQVFAYHSPLPRSRESASILLDTLGVPQERSMEKIDLLNLEPPGLSRDKQFETLDNLLVEHETVIFSTHEPVIEAYGLYMIDNVNKRSVDNNTNITFKNIGYGTCVAINCKNGNYRVFRPTKKDSFFDSSKHMLPEQYFQ